MMMKAEHINLATWNIKTPYVFKILGLTMEQCEHDILI